MDDKNWDLSKTEVEKIDRIPNSIKTNLNSIERIGERERTYQIDYPMLVLLMFFFKGKERKPKRKRKSECDWLKLTNVVLNLSPQPREREAFQEKVGWHGCKFHINPRVFW
jgi:hypothetical protein